MKPPVGLESQINNYDLSLWNIEFTLESDEYKMFLVSNSGTDDDGNPIALGDKLELTRWDKEDGTSVHWPDNK